MDEGADGQQLVCHSHLHVLGIGRRKGGRKAEYEKGGTFVKGMGIERLGTCGDWNKNINVVSGGLV